MALYEDPIASPAERTAANFRSVARARAVARAAIPALSGIAKEALFAYAMTGSAVASLAIIAVPHLEVLLRCVLHGRG